MASENTESFREDQACQKNAWVREIAIRQGQAAPDGQKTKFHDVIVSSNPF